MHPSPPNVSTEDAPDPAIAALLARAAQGDQAAWRQLVHLYAPRIFAMAQSRCHDAHTSEDITQGVLTTLCAQVRSGDYHEQGRFESWLFRITMNRVRDLARHKARTTRILGPRVAADDTLDAAAPPDTRHLTDQAGTLAAALERLSPQDREVIDLRHHAGLSFKQISELLDEPVGTLLARHHRALQKLREMLEPPPAADNSHRAQAFGSLKGS